MKLDPEFAQTIETGAYPVFLQAEGECKGLSVRSRTKTGFMVQELAGGRSNVPFASGSWRCGRTCRRRGCGA